MEFKMLILTRTEGESILIYPQDDIPEGMTVAELFADGAIEIVVDETRKHQVKIGVKAPDELKILRSELLDDETPTAFGM